MAELSRNKALLIACRALNPFVTFDLLKTAGGSVQPISGAEDILIGDLLVTLSGQDEKFGLHVVDSIMNSIFAACKDEGFSVGLSKSKMVKGKYATIGDLVDQMVDTAGPIEE